MCKLDAQASPFLQLCLCRREADEAKLEERRRSIRERIQRQHEIAAKLASERAVAEERARTEMEKFIKGKPLYEKLMEEYEQNRKQEVRRLGGGGVEGQSGQVQSGAHEGGLLS